jgi:hypothetical protein
MGQGEQMRRLPVSGFRDDLDWIKVLGSDVHQIHDRQGTAFFGGKFTEGIAPEVVAHIGGLALPPIHEPTQHARWGSRIKARTLRFRRPFPFNIPRHRSNSGRHRAKEGKWADGLWDNLASPC